MTVLAHDILGDGAESIVFVHGILGSGRNWASFARRASAEWGVRALTVDLRGHGESSDIPGDNTVDACACDLAELAAHLGEEPTWVLGHSFGGKVSARYARLYAASLQKLVLLDAPVGPSGPSDVEEVIDAVAEIPLPIGDRRELVDSLRAQGFSTGLARWMTTNLERCDDGLRWRFNIDRIRLLLNDYRILDERSVLSATDFEVHAVVGGRSSRALRSEASGLGSRLHVLENAGHWLHADDPKGLFDILTEIRRAPSP